MQDLIYTVLSNECITANGLIYKMRLGGDVSAITAPGQFVNIQLDGFFLRRPISVCDVRENALTIIYKVVGQGTAAMSKLGRVASQGRGSAMDGACERKDASSRKSVSSSGSDAMGTVSNRSKDVSSRIREGSVR